MKDFKKKTPCDALKPRWKKKDELTIGTGRSLIGAYGRLMATVRDSGSVYDYMIQHDVICDVV